MAAILSDILKYIFLGVFFAFSSVWIAGTFYVVYIECGNLLRKKKVSPVTAFILMVLIDLFLVMMIGYLLAINM